MDYAVLMVLVALIEYMFFSMMVGKARVDGKVDAPAVSGNPHFERVFRVQQNTMEQLVVFIPAILLFANYWPELIGLILGIVFVIGRFLFYRSYVADPKTRTIGFLLTFFPNAILVIGALVGVILKLLAQS